MGLKPSSVINPLLFWNNICLPMYNGHYTTTKNVVIFSNLACIENSLTGFSCGLKNMCSNCKNYLGNNLWLKNG